MLQHVNAEPTIRELNFDQKVNVIVYKLTLMFYFLIFLFVIKKLFILY